MRPPEDQPRIVLFAYGFRPFFLLAGLYAVAAILVWIIVYPGPPLSIAGMPAQYWHSHEMIFGFVAAAIAGFLLTAVPSWTGQRGFAGKPLVMLVLVWLAGRVAFFLGGTLPVSVLAAIELLFVPALIAVVAPSLLRTPNRNRPLLLVLLVFWLMDAVFLYGLVSAKPAMASAALRAALNLVLVLITVIGGRIVPAFTANALRKQGLEPGIRTSPLIEYSVIAAMLLFAVADTMAPFAAGTAIIAALAALLQAIRLAGWGMFRTGSQPIVWILHVAYLWLPIGLALKAVSLTWDPGWAMHWQHALGAGAAATMILAVMTRAALGHTGRELRVQGGIVLAYVLITLSVVLRVFGPATGLLDYKLNLQLSGGLWCLSFALFLFYYLPILLTPRIDGRPG